MPIRVVCECGSKLDAPDHLAGKQARCGGCGRVLTIERSMDPEIPDDEEAEEAGDPASEVRLPPRVVRKRKKVFQGASPIVEEGPSRKKRLKPAPATSERPRSQAEPTLVDVWARGLAFPFRREAFITILVLAVLYGPPAAIMSFTPALLMTGAFGLKGMVGLGAISFGILGYFCYFLFQTLRTAAQNEDDLPVATAFDFEEIFIDLWLMLGATAVLFCPLAFLAIGAFFADSSLPAAIWIPMLVLFVYLWPMAVTSAALHTSVLAANHWTVIRTVLKIPLQYTATLCIAAGLILIATMIDLWTPRFPILSGFVFWLLVFLTVTACMYLIGNLYYRNRARIGWFAELQQRY
jgi:hypothetical protein